MNLAADGPMTAHAPGTRALLFALLVVLVSCSDATGVDESSPVGSWDMSSIGGQALPMDSELAGIESGLLDIRANGSFALRIRGHFFEIPFDYTVPGDWTQTGMTVFLNRQGVSEQAGDFTIERTACQDVALLDGNVLTIDADCEDGQEIVFSRR